MGIARSIADSFEAYGYRRMQAELRQCSFIVKHQKARRLMRGQDLQPRHPHHRQQPQSADFPELAKDMALDGPNQLWVADITYVAISSGFVYVAVVLDLWSRWVVGCTIGRSMNVRLTLAALRSAVAQRRTPQVACITSTLDRRTEPDPTGQRLRITDWSARRAARQSLRQCQGREHYEDLEDQSRAPDGLRHVQRRRRPPSALHRSDLQQNSPALGAGLPQRSPVHELHTRPLVKTAA
ncbi:DDE-type integrase/transposase/recombinase [Alsobacter sp. SYSU M60028]|uniref:DDE-type integrase/transposase/recombinase n=1 Tax=Alsobacter ponti TaxID=2962936 RepID=A0ABT1LER8_9HYPH|nr:DDE-type integrase/transposase/recombinase [Alsobacter ponti]MCP8939924.1 DDE-type integrase/transposase/recombinase [Alsobacter ponti]